MHIGDALFLTLEMVELAFRYKDSYHRGTDLNTEFILQVKNQNMVLLLLE